METDKQKGWTNALNTPYKKAVVLKVKVTTIPQFYIDEPPSSIMKEWRHDNVQSHITGVITSGFKTWYGIIDKSPRDALNNMFIKIVWDKLKLPKNIQIFIGKDSHYKEWEYRLKFVEVCNITISAKDMISKFQLVILGDTVTVEPTDQTFVLS